MSTRGHLRGRAQLGALPGLAPGAGGAAGPGARGSSRDPPPAPSAARRSPGKLGNAHTHPRNPQEALHWAFHRGTGESGTEVHASLSFREQGSGRKGGGGPTAPMVRSTPQASGICRPRPARSLGAEAGRQAPRAPPATARSAGRPRAGGGSPTWKCWKKAEMRVICRLRHLDEQRARWTLTADRDSSSRRAAAAPGPPARQPPQASSQRQRVRAAPGAPGSMAAGRGRGVERGRRALAEAPSSAPGPHCREPRGGRNSAGKFNHSTPAPRPPRQPPPGSASRGGVRVTGRRAIGCEGSE